MGGQRTCSLILISVLALSASGATSSCERRPLPQVAYGLRTRADHSCEWAQRGAAVGPCKPSAGSNDEAPPPPPPPPPTGAGGRVAEWFQNLWSAITDEHAHRGGESWRFLYLDELMAPFKPLVLDRTVDERLANLVYTVSLLALEDAGYYEFNSGNPQEDRLRAAQVVGPQVDDEQCALDLVHMSHQMDELGERLAKLRSGGDGGAGRLEDRHLRLARVLDSYGRYESAMLMAHYRLTGSYIQCTGSTLERPASGGDMAMRFCWAELSVADQLSEQLRVRQRLALETNRDVISLGACLPRSCHTKNLHSHKQIVQKFVDSQFVLPASIYVNQSLKLNSVFCLVDPDSEQAGLPPSGRLFVVFLASWLALCFMATCLRIGELNTPPASPTPPRPAPPGASTTKSEQTRLSPALRLLGYLNLRLSWRDFTADKELATAPLAARRVELDVLNPVKVYAAAFVVAAHSALMFAKNAARQAEVAARVEQDVFIQTGLMATVVVDTFFVISGLVLTFVALKKLSAGYGFGQGSRRAGGGRNRAQNSAAAAAAAASAWWPAMGVVHFLANWLAMAANRYLRLVPLYVIMFWFRRDVLAYLGAGPLWDFGFNKDTSTGACRQETWLTPFSFRSAFVPLSRQCYVPSWSISNDILFGLTIPPVIQLLQRRPRLTLCLLLATILGVTLNTVQAYVDADPENRWQLGDLRLHGFIQFFNSLSYLYTSPLYRLSSYLIGTIAGYALFKFDRKASSRGRDVRWPVWLSGWATKLAAVYLIAHVLLSFQLMWARSLLHPHHRLLAFFVFNLDRPLWSAANAIIFLRMMTDWRQSGRMRSWAGQKWRTLARLNFALLFTHWIFIVIQNNVLMSLPTYSLWQVWATFAGVYSMGSIAAMFAHVVFENPIDLFVKRELFAL